jgi:hypothetical protein
MRWFTIRGPHDVRHIYSTFYFIYDVYLTMSVTVYTTSMIGSVNNKFESMWKKADEPVSSIPDEVTRFFN